MDPIDCIYVYIQILGDCHGMGTSTSRENYRIRFVETVRITASLEMRPLRPEIDYEHNHFVTRKT